jgi:ABC-type methionine transport system ATPase subunit
MKSASSRPSRAVSQNIMPRKTAPAARAGKAAVAGPEKRRFWLTYPSKLITRPIIWELSRKFDIIFNVRQASVTDEIGILCLELEGQREDLKAGIAWLERQGVKVEPVEINVIES